MCSLLCFSEIMNDCNVCQYSYQRHGCIFNFHPDHYKYWQSNIRLIPRLGRVFLMHKILKRQERDELIFVDYAGMLSAC